MATADSVKALENRNIKGDFVLDNRMYGVYGIHPEHGFCIDVYTDALRDDLVFSRMSLGFDNPNAESDFIAFKKSFDEKNSEMSLNELMTFLDNL